MKALLSVSLMTIAAVGIGFADVPRKAPLTKYQKLWTDSPFTAKPLGQTGPVFNPLEHYVLLGVSPVIGGYRVTLLNKKKPTDPRIIVESNKPAQGFQVLEVIRKEGDPLATVVRMASGGTKGTIGFEEKFLKIDVRAPAKVTAQANSNGSKAGTPRPSRPRIVRPAVPRASSSPTPQPPVPQPPVSQPSRRSR